MLLKLTMYCLRTIRIVFLSLRFAFFRFILIAGDYPNDVEIQRNRSIYTAESRQTENTLVNAKQIVQLLLMTVSNDEKPMLFLHSNSFGALIRKQAFHTRLSPIFHPCILVPHFPILHFPPLHF